MEGGVALSALPKRAVGTFPPQPPPRGPSVARRIGAGALGVALAALGAVALYRATERPRNKPRRRERPARLAGAARYLNGTASILSFSVLTDSALEHYRGTFHNPAMYVAPVVAAVSLANSLPMTVTPERYGTARTALCGLALATGVAGTGFHLYNVAKREGGMGLLNLFYGAPLGAPAAIALAGLAGLAASRLTAENDDVGPVTLLGQEAGPLLAAGAAGGLLGTVAEVALLHFRGAFHDPFMYLPVTLPPLTALALLAAAVKRERGAVARPMLYATALLGIAGMGFHAYGVQRNMGGFRNWSQNILQGPPLPAPPAFTGVALAGLAALDLMEER